MAIAGNEQLGMLNRFSVTVENGLNLGHWRECKGLTVTQEHEDIKEGGNNQNHVMLATIVKYEPIVLARAMNATDSPKLQKWLGEKFRGADPGHLSAEGGIAFAKSMIPSIGAQFMARGDAVSITLYDARGEIVYTWELRNAFPIKWEGPAMDGVTSKIAEEKLTLFHEGFLSDTVGAIVGAVVGVAGAVAAGAVVGAVAGGVSASVSIG